MSIGWRASLENLITYEKLLIYLSAFVESYGILNFSYFDIQVTKQYCNNIRKR